MARIPRLLNPYEPTFYHVMSRTALDGFPLGDVEKDYLLEVIQRCSQLYFVDVFGICLMSNHFHILLRVNPEEGYTDQQIRDRIQSVCKDKEKISDQVVNKYRHKLGCLSEYMKEVKQTFTRYYNKQHKRKGFFWGQRYKSVIVEKGETLANCLAYIDLNPVRAGIVDRPEDYRWNTLGYLYQRGDGVDLDSFLFQEFGLENEQHLSQEERVSNYRRFVYRMGALESSKGASIKTEILQREEKKEFKVSKLDCFRQRTRYFTDSGVIGSKRFVLERYNQFSEYFTCKHPKKPFPIQGMEGVFSLKRLAT